MCKTNKNQETCCLALAWYSLHFWGEARVHASKLCLGAAKEGQVSTGQFRTKAMTVIDRD